LTGVNHQAQVEAEARVLGTLCIAAASRERCTEIISALDRYEFLEPEHQILFGSIRALLERGRLSTANLAVHLNNRGFPDVDLEKYRAAGLPGMDEAVQLAGQLVSLAECRGDEVRYDSQGKIKHEI
jgi:hypothetical protein